MEAFLVSPGPASGPPPAAPEPAPAATGWSGDLASSDPWVSDETRVDDTDKMLARNCNPRTGRFLSVDPANRYKATAAPQAWNRYAYVGNNPIGFYDPDGLLRIRANFRGFTELPRRPVFDYTIHFETKGFLVREKVNKFGAQLLPGRAGRIAKGAKAVEKGIGFVGGGSFAKTDSDNAFSSRSALSSTTLAATSFESSVQERFKELGGKPFFGDNPYPASALGTLNDAIGDVASEMYLTGDISFLELQDILKEYDVERLKEEAENDPRDLDLIDDPAAE